MAILEEIMIDVTSYDIEGLITYTTKVFTDDRGLFTETYHKNKFNETVENVVFTQDNQSVSKKNVLRGLHFQNPPHEQGKLIRVISGSILDVAVDLRRNSKTYGRYVKVLLSAENRVNFWIPAGFAHGFLSMEDNTLVNYKCTSMYDTESEGSLRWNDPDLNIDWGIENPIVSEKDEIAPLFSNFNSQF
jgi:dTDP-4-dehydrorhamnose 3,5-epimerase